DATGGLGRIGRYLPGAAGAAMSGQEPSRLLDPIVALLVLGAYAVVTAASGAATTARRDVG
ncbi:MAG TPA: ABC transporter permease, partial [Actinomycetota bacterium]|nr:ABC transporter permease [Actinomycetota bacterium]